MVIGLASILLIGLSIVLRTENEADAADLADAVAELEEHTHRELTQLRARVRELQEERAEPMAPQQRPPSEPFATSEPQRRHYDEPHPHQTPPRFEPDHRHGEARNVNPRRPETAPPWGREPDERFDTRHRPEPAMPASQRDTDGYTPPTPGEQRRRREAALEATGEMARITESVSGGRHETARPVDFNEAGHGPTGYQHSAESPGRFSKLRLPKFGRGGQQDGDADADADSLLSGLGRPSSGAQDWFGGDDQRAPDERDRQRPRYADPAPGGRRTDERSDPRTGMRQGRNEPEDAWNGSDGAYRGGTYPVETDRSEGAPVGRARQRGPVAPPHEGGRTPRGYEEYGGSYMDRYYGER